VNGSSPRLVIRERRRPARTRWPLRIAILLAMLLAALLLWSRSGPEQMQDAAGHATASAPADDPAWDPGSAWAGASALAPGRQAEATPSRRLGDGLVLAPHMIEGRLAGYVVAAASDEAALAGARLQPGDLLLDMDGRQLDQGRMAGLGDELALADSVEVTFERDGQIRRRVIDLRD